MTISPSLVHLLTICCVSTYLTWGKPQQKSWNMKQFYKPCSMINSGACSKKTAWKQKNVDGLLSDCGKAKYTSLSRHWKQSSFSFFPQNASHNNHLAWSKWTNMSSPFAEPYLEMTITRIVPMMMYHGIWCIINPKSKNYTNQHIQPHMKPPIYLFLGLAAVIRYFANCSYIFLLPSDVKLSPTDTTLVLNRV